MAALKTRKFKAHLCLAKADAPIKVIREKVEKNIWN